MLGGVGGVGKWASWHSSVNPPHLRVRELPANSIYAASANPVQLLFRSSYSSFPSSFSNNNQSPVSGGASISVPTIPVSASMPNPSLGSGGVAAASGGFSELRSSNGSRKARVLYDYDAAGSSELSLLADEVGLT